MPDDVLEGDNPTEGLPIEGSDSPTTEGEAIPPVVEGEAMAPQEPGTEAEGFEGELAPPSDTAEVTQEAPLMEEGPVVEAGAGREPPAVPAFALEYKPKSDVYTLLLIFTFFVFTTVAVLAGKEGYDFYDCEFFLFGKETIEERKQREAEEAAEAAARGEGPAPAPAPAPAPGPGPTPPPDNPAPPPGGGGN
jgi:hypothetical protein